MKQLDPKAVWYLLLNSISQVFIFLLPFITMFIVFSYQLKIGKSIDPSNPGLHIIMRFYDWLWVIIPFFLIPCYIWAKLSYNFYKYELTDLGFKKELGVIYKKYVTIPYDRIQNVDIDRGIVARLLGLSDLNIQTAGSGTVVATGEGRLPGLSKQIAEELRDELVKRSLASRKGQGL